MGLGNKLALSPASPIFFNANKIGEAGDEARNKLGLQKIYSIEFHTKTYQHVGYNFY